jgi:uncharacterized protein
MSAEKVLIIVFILLLMAVLLESAYIWYSGQNGFFPIKEYKELPSTNPTEIYLPSGAHGHHYIVNPDGKTILYCHGNGGNISYWTDMVELITSLGINIFIFDYRGFGKAKGQVIIEDIVTDSFEAYDYLSKRVKPEDIILWGESFGGYAALHVALRKKIGLLTLAATFTKASDMMDYYDMPWYYKLMAKRSPLDNKKMISQYRGPTVIIHSPTDKMIPYECAQKLYDASGSSCKLLIPIDGDHTSPKLTRENLTWLLDFCEIDTTTSHVDPLLEKICNNTEKNCPFRVVKRNGETLP